jgi:hypothetical protein
MQGDRQRDRHRQLGSKGERQVKTGREKAKVCGKTCGRIRQGYMPEMGRAGNR